MVRVSFLLVLFGAIIAWVRPGLASSPVIESRTTAGFRITMRTGFIRFRDRQSEQRYHKRTKAQFRRALARLVPRIKTALRTLAMRHKGVFSFARYHPKHPTALEEPKHRIGRYDSRRRRLPRSAKGPFNYHVSLPDMIDLEIALNRIPTARWRKTLVQILRKTVSAAMSSTK